MKQVNMENKRNIIIIVDDNITNLTVAKNNLSEKFNVFTAPSGKKLFQLLEKVTPDLILLDIEMPEMDGFEVLRILKSTEHQAHIPVFFLTAKIDPENEVKGLNMGAVDYITKPFSRELLLKRIELHISFEKQRQEIMNYSHNLEGEISKKTKMVFELQSAILRTVAELVECRDSVTGGHIERTQNYLRLLVDFLLEHDIYTAELLSWDVNLFIMSSQLHDVGKISIKDEILMKTGDLTSEEFEEMKKHAQYGVDIIKRIEGKTTENELMNFAGIMAGNHHEKWDGTGYPQGLKGTDIPLAGRLMAIVDVYDALTNDSPYKKSLAHEEAVEIIRQGAGTHFDPLIAETFLAHEKEFKNLSLGKDLPPLSEKQEPRQNLSSALKLLINIMDFRGGSDEHTESIQRYLEIFINALAAHPYYKKEISGWHIDLFLMSSQLHDIGKMAVKDNILNKNSKLTRSEFDDIKNHTEYGIKIIKKIKENVDGGSMLHHAEALAGCHHERWDGSGYPLGLRGSGIPLQGRIMAIVDAYEALTSDRPHRIKKTHKEAVEIIRSGAGTQFDPGLVKIFIEQEKEFEKGAVA